MAHDLLMGEPTIVWPGGTIVVGGVQMRADLGNISMITDSAARDLLVPCLQPRDDTPDLPLLPDAL